MKIEVEIRLVYFDDDTPVQMQPVQSSLIQEIGYNEASRVLGIRFKRGVLYRYDSVELATFEGLRDATSIGQHFLEHIKPQADKYPYKKINEDDRDIDPSTWPGRTEDEK